MNLNDARKRIDDLRELNAFISLTDEAGDGPIVAVKDIIDVRGTITTGGGALLPARAATDDAPVVKEIRRFGCVIVGKANLSEFAYGPTGENALHGPVRNFHDPARISGGSSAGSAVAVAAGMCDWSIGTDTGGSLRIPAALNGVVAFKPTRGLVSTEGVIPVSTTLDVVGPIGPDVVTTVRGLEMMAGLTDLVPSKAQSPDHFRLAVPKGWATNLDDTTDRSWQRVSAGLPLIPFPSHQELAAAQITILQSEATYVHRDWMQQSPDKYSAHVLTQLKIGLTIVAPDYIKALAQEKVLTAEVEAAMADVDAVIVPVTACVAPLIGHAEPIERLLRFTKGFSVTGQPVISIPAPSDGLPVGIQVIGHRGQDALVAEIALALEQAWKTLAAWT